MIDVEHERGEGPVVPSRTLELASRQLKEMAMIWQTRQVVGDGQAVHFTIELRIDNRAGHLTANGHSQVDLIVAESTACVHVIERHDADGLTLAEEGYNQEHFNPKGRRPVLRHEIGARTVAQQHWAAFYDRLLE